MKILIFLLVFLLSSCQGESLPVVTLHQPMRNTYNVAPNGDDNNPGTPEQPWKTIQNAANFGYGKIYISSGIYPERVIVKRSGLEFEAQGDVKMNGFTITGNNTTVNGFDITTTSAEQPEGMGIYVEAESCLLENNHIHDTVRDGILLRNPSSNCVVINNKIQHASQSGIELQGTNNRIENNEIWDTIQYPAEWVDPPSWVDADGIRFFGSGHIIKGNYIHDIRYKIPENIDPHIDCFQTWGDKSRGGTTHDIVFEQNYCDNLATTESLAGKAWQIEGGPYNLTMKNNIVIANLVAIIRDGRDFAFLNNTFIGDPGNLSEGIKAERIVNLKIINNIFYYQRNGTGAIFVDAVTQETISSGYNCIYEAGGNRPSDVGELRLDPLLTSDYHLQPNSPCIDSGIDVGIQVDSSSNVMKQGKRYDIGAFGNVAVP